MTAGTGRPFSPPTRFKLLLLLAGPFLVTLSFALGSLGDASSASRMQREADRLVSSFDDSMRHAAMIARTALETSPTQAARIASDGPMAKHMEGVGILDSELTFLQWEGTPAEPPTGFGRPESPAWHVRKEGLRVRLLVRAGPDARGRTALASFVLDSRDGAASPFVPLSMDPTAGVRLDLHFKDTAGFYGEALVPPSAIDLPPASLAVSLRSPQGDLIAEASLVPIPESHRRQIRRRTGRAWAVSLFWLLVALLFRWHRLARSASGLLLALLLLVFARWSLLSLDVAARILPRELGSASLYGSSAFGGLFGSPAELLLSGVALLLGCLLLRNFCATLAVGRRGLALTLAASAAVGAASMCIAITLSLARDSRLSILDRQHMLLSWDTRLLLQLALVVAMLGAAELAGLIWTLLRSPRGGPTYRAGRITVVLALLIQAVVCSATLQWMSQRLAVERLGSEFARSTLDQASRRELALTEAVSYVQEIYGGDEEPTSVLDSPPRYLAYHFWINGELGHSGYKSSLDFFTPNGDLVSHFGFGLPLLLDEEPLILESTNAVELRDEELSPVSEYPAQLIHAEVPVLRNGQLLGIVVGHVLDEPGNLPFLPASQPYLNALGAGLPRRLSHELAGGPQYVRYDEYGRVLIRTLTRPPALADVQPTLGLKSRPVRFRSADGTFVGIALDDRGQTHLLLVSARTLLERLAAAVRLALLGGLSLILFGLLRRLSRPGGLPGLVEGLRGSFYRKLLAALLVASVVPLVGLALFVQGYMERRGDAELDQVATRLVSVAQRVLQDYVATQAGAVNRDGLNDDILYWLRSVVGQEIHVYEDGRLEATSKRELFSSGLLPVRLDGRVQRRLVEGGLPYLVLPVQVGEFTMPVAYAALHGSDLHRTRVVAVPMVLEQRKIAGDVARVTQLILLATVLLVGLLALAAALLARTVARPLRELVDATGQIAAGDYETRLVPRTRDEVAELVSGFNSMASSLAAQRADLERRREYMERLLRHATTGVISTDREGRIVTINPAAQQLLASDVGPPAVGAGLIGALSASETLAPLARVLDSVPARRGEAEEVDLRRGDLPRRYRLFRIELSEPTDDVGGSLILLDDVTDLMRSNQLAAWAEMARAIAHEIKNPLTPIQLSTEHLRKLLNDRGVLPSPEVEACLDTVIKQVRSLHDIAGEFSTYAKLPDLKPEPHDPVALMRTVIGPYRAGEPQGISIEECYAETPPIAADLKVLSRAVINLIENALQAMPTGGTLTVSVGLAEGNKDVKLAVSDTGPGLDPEVERRLFEPYFSTKSSGTGLGLAIVRRAVEAHKGRIVVESRQNVGTTFAIHLPIL